MIPGEILTREGEIVLNEGREALSLKVANTAIARSRSGRTTTSPRPNPALDFDRAARGMRLDIAAGTPCGSSPASRATCA